MPSQPHSASHGFHRAFWRSAHHLRTPMAILWATAAVLLLLAPLPAFTQAGLSVSLMAGSYGQFVAWRLALDEHLFERLDDGNTLQQLDGALQDHGISKPVGASLQRRVTGTVRLWKHTLLGFALQTIAFLVTILGKVVAQQLYN